MAFTLGDKRRVTIELTTRMLGTVPKDKEIYTSYIALMGKDLAEKVNGKDNAQIDEEVETVEQIEAKGWTGFHFTEPPPKATGLVSSGDIIEAKVGLLIYEYMIKGHIKAACESLMEIGSFKKIPAYKKWIDRMVFVSPRRIYVGKLKPDGCLERPLRVMTPKGERVSITKSDYLDAGTQISFDMEILKNTKGVNWDMVIACMDYGAYIGLGQWRGSGGYGRYDVVSVSPPESVPLKAPEEE